MSESTKHKFIFVGDVVLQSQPHFDAGMQALMAAAQIRGCNFEAPLQGLGQPIRKTGPHVAQRPEAPLWLKELGFNLYNLANNHIFDYGADAMYKTEEAIGIEHVIGISNDDAAYGMTLKHLDGVKYGFLAYGENGYGALNGDRMDGHAWVNAPQVNQQIKDYSKEADILIVQVHAGVELLNVPIPEWRQRYRELIDQGADMVIAHHPHIVQGVEEYKGKPIFYSLGNFYFDYPSNHPAWNTGAVLELDFADKALQGYQIHIVQKEKDLIKLQDRTFSDNYMQVLNDLLNSPDYEAYVDSKAVEEWEKHHAAYYAKPFNGLASYSLTKLLKHAKRTLFNRQIDYNMIWHNMFIESNKWLVERAIRNKMKQQ